MAFLCIFTDQIPTGHGTARICMLMAFCLRLLAYQLPAAFRMSMALALCFLTGQYFAAVSMLVAFALLFLTYQGFTTVRVHMSFGFLQLTDQNLFFLVAAFLMDMGFHLVQLADQLAVTIVAIVIVGMHRIIRIAAGKGLLPGFRIAFIAFLRMLMQLQRAFQHLLFVAEGLAVHLQCGDGAQRYHNGKAEKYCQPAPVFFLLTQ